MFELAVAIKYLLPKKHRLSTSLISLLSIVVISLVVWLVLVFLSVTTGIEKNWLDKLTSLNAPIRISPNNNYYTSYYYQIDSLSAASDFSYKTIYEKANSNLTDPYDEEIDSELPYYFQKPKIKNGKLIDPVKDAYSALSNIAGITFQDYELSASLMKLTMKREKTSITSQMLYLLSLPDKNPKLPSLLTVPNNLDLENILATLKNKDLIRFFSFVNIDKLKTDPNWTILATSLPNGTSLYAKVEKEVQQLKLTQEDAFLTRGVYRDGFFLSNGKKYPIAKDAKVSIDQQIELKANLDTASLEKANAKEDVYYDVSFTYLGKSIQIKIPYAYVTIAHANPNISFVKAPKKAPLWSYQVNNTTYIPSSEGVLLPKVFQKSGALLGDEGIFTYTSAGLTGVQDQKVPFTVMGFYDPGVLPIGNRSVLASYQLSHDLYAGSKDLALELPTNGIFVWFDDLKQASFYKAKIEKAFLDEGILPYFDIETYKDFSFSKDLLQQFQSDRTLFTLIAAIILIVACCNIISLLVLLVNDKKKEVAIMQAMGASRLSIASIFGLCGVIMGVISSLIGVVLALITLKNIDGLISLLSSIQGDIAFNPAFFGDTLPNALSFEALSFILIATPLLSLIAGLIPAIKAAYIKPSTTLRMQ